MPSTLKAALFGAAALALSACSTTGLGALTGGGLFNSRCDPGTQVQLSNPVPNQSNVSTNQGQVTIVASGNNNTLYNTYGQWQIVLQDNYGNRITGGTLNLVPRNGPQPYASDFYYASSIPTLNYGTTYTAYLNNTNSNCTLDPLQSFST